MRTIIGGGSICIATLALAACAAGGPPRPVAATPTAAAPAKTVADSKTSAAVPYSFQLVTKNGQEFYCRRERVTGSHTKTQDVCLTKAQMEAQIAGTQDFLGRMQDSPTKSSSSDGNGGRYNSVVTQ